MTLSWPDTDAVKRLFNVTDDEFNDDVDGLAASAIERVKLDCGLTLEDGSADPDADPVTPGQVEASKRAMVLLRAGSNDGLEGIGKDRVYNGLIMGKRKRRGFA